MNRKLVAAGVLALAGAVAAVSAYAQARPDVLVKQRQSAMVLLGKYFFGELRLMARGKIPYDAQQAARAAGFVEALGQMPWDGFHPSTKGEQSRALPAVFQDPDKFMASANRMNDEIAKLVVATRNGDESAVKAQIAAVDKSCSSCHKAFRE